MSEPEWARRQREDEAYKRRLQAEDEQRKRQESDRRDRERQEAYNQDMRKRDDDKMKQQQKERQESGGCFVATAAYGDYNAPEVIFLRLFRDKSLSRTTLGRGFIKTYYIVSPPVASVIAKSESLRKIVRKFFLKPLILLLKLFKCD